MAFAAATLFVGKFAGPRIFTNICDDKHAQQDFRILKRSIKYHLLPLKAPREQIFFARVNK